MVNGIRVIAAVRKLQNFNALTIETQTWPEDPVHPDAEGLALLVEMSAGRPSQLHPPHLKPFKPS